MVAGRRRIAVRQINPTQGSSHETPKENRQTWAHCGAPQSAARESGLQFDRTSAHQNHAGERRKRSGRSPKKWSRLGKKGSLHARRTALAVLRQKDAVKKLFDDIAPRSASRNGGYTRIIKLGQRKSDSAAVAFIEWVDAPKRDGRACGRETARKRKPAKEAAATDEAKPAKKSAKPQSSKKDSGRIVR